jgi:hypothetical protein
MLKTSSLKKPRSAIQQKTVPDFFLELIEVLLEIMKVSLSLSLLMERRGVGPENRLPANRQVYS